MPMPIDQQKVYTCSRGLHDEFLIKQREQSFVLDVRLVFGVGGEFLFWAKADADKRVTRSIARDRNQISSIQYLDLCEMPNKSNR